jgi:UDP-glucuronate 4-epimerase
VRVLVTGVAGFIGMHCALRLIERGDEVVGVDNLSPYYSVDLKRARLRQIPSGRLSWHELDIADGAALGRLFDDTKPDAVLHLAAQAGVRYSLQNPGSYIQANLVGFANLLECCRRHKPGHLVFASSSSVYGSNTKLPYSESDNVDHPVSLYAATKKSNELMAHAYSHLFGIDTTGLRFFTVYGPWGRPDMSPWLFADAIMQGRPIQVFNHGDMQRDFTYIDDIVEGTLRVLDKPSRYAIYNIGNHSPVQLLDYVAAMEHALGRKATIEMKPMQPGDVKATYADTSALAAHVGFAPSTPLDAGLGRFARWFKDYHGLK